MCDSEEKKRPKILSPARHGRAWKRDGKRKLNQTKTDAEHRNECVSIFFSCRFSTKKKYNRFRCAISIYCVYRGHTYNTHRHHIRWFGFEVDDIVTVLHMRIAHIIQTYKSQWVVIESVHRVCVLPLYGIMPIHTMFIHSYNRIRYEFNMNHVRIHTHTHTLHFS